MRKKLFLFFERIKFKLSSFYRKCYSKYFGVFEDIYYYLIYFIVYIFLSVGVIILAIRTMFRDNFEELIEIAQMGAILTATLAMLTFTYATTFDYNVKTIGDKKNLIHAGKYFYKSCLNFIIGIILITGFGEAFIHSIENNDMLRLVINGIFIFFSFIILIYSIVYFAVGIINSLKILK